MTESFRLKPYLRRIGLAEAPAPTLAGLATLQAAHMRAIPFESLDPLLRRPVLLDLESLQAKLVDGARGGFCFEQNLLFSAALEALGFTVTGLTGRVLWMSKPGAAPGPRTHMLLRVELPEGPHLADVGFGACLLDAPLPMRGDGSEHRTALATLRLHEMDGNWELSAKLPTGWRRAYSFDLTPQVQSDYEMGCWFAATNPASPFPTTLIVERLAPGARHKLINREYVRETRDGRIEHRAELADPDAFGATLSEVFGIRLPAASADIFSRLPPS